MKFSERIKKIGKTIATELMLVDNPKTSEQGVARRAETSAYYGGYNGWSSASPVYPMVYDGELNTGEVGPIYQYFLDYQRLRLRCRQLYLESEIAKAAVDKNTKWVIGRGLELKCEPKVNVLKMLGIDVSESFSEEFNETVEAFWDIYANSKQADITGRMTLHELTAESYNEKVLVGDMLVLLIPKNGVVKVKHIDAINVVTPGNFTFNGIDYEAPNGNRVRNGVEIDGDGRHVAYYVRKDMTGFDCLRVEAYGRRSGMRMAYLCTNDKYTVDSERGMSSLMSVIEPAKKLQRYVSAALAGAEERQKIHMFIEHTKDSDEEDPLASRRARTLAGRGDLKADVAVDAEGNKKAADIYASTNKTTINMGTGQSIKAIDSKQEAEVEEFGSFNIDIIAAALDMPPDVLMSKYENSFSASRMSGKDWEHTFLTRRANHAREYLTPIFDLQLYLWILANKVQAPGYLAAMRTGDETIVEAYNRCRWDGDKFPDIDPLKTIKYLREAMGPGLAHVPIMDPEAAAEHINQGEVTAIIKQSKKYMDEANAAGIKPEEKSGVKQIKDDDGDGNPPVG